MAQEGRVATEYMRTGSLDMGQAEALEMFDPEIRLAFSRWSCDRLPIASRSTRGLQIPPSWDLKLVKKMVAGRSVLSMVDKVEVGGNGAKMDKMAAAKRTTIRGPVSWTRTWHSGTDDVGLDEFPRRKGKSRRSRELNGKNARQAFDFAR